ncbi:hypothetical protein [Nonomuraea lactucae]|nr:hypothetical protein [Nonomuraea lactucae]
MSQPDWIPWNEALATLALVGHLDLVHAALATSPVIALSGQQLTM